MDSGVNPVQLPILPGARGSLNLAVFVWLQWWRKASCTAWGPSTPQPQRCSSGRGTRQATTKSLLMWTGSCQSRRPTSVLQLPGGLCCVERLAGSCAVVGTSGPVLGMCNSRGLSRA